MHNLQSIIARSVNNSLIQFEKLGYLSTSATNFNTTGFKGKRFENILTDSGRVKGVVRTDFKVGDPSVTGRELDIALTGPGFIPVTKKDGEMAFTRDGSLKVNAQGYLVTNSGDVVANGIKIPPVRNKLQIDTDGSIQVQMEKYGEFKKIGEIPLVSFTNPEGLESQDGNKLVATAESGDAMLMTNHKYVQQGSLERSNVSIYDTVHDVLKLNAGVISGTRLIKIVDEMYRQSINLKQ